MDTLKGVEILAVGTWPAQTGDVTISKDDLREIAANFARLAGKVQIPLKFGHDDDQKLLDQEGGDPALGWVTNLRVSDDGRKLLGDFERVSPIVHGAIAAGMYDRLSAEFFNDVVVNDERIGQVLTAVALLGADLPAITDIKSLSAYLAMDLTKFERTVFTGSFKPQGASAETPKPKEQGMIEESKLELAALQAKVDKLSQAADENAQLKTQLAQHQAKEKEQAESTRIDTFRSQRETFAARLETLVKDGKVQPILRDQIVDSLDKQKEVFSIGSGLRMEAEQVIGMLEKFSTTLPEGEQGEGAGQSKDGPKVTPDAELDDAVTKLMAERKIANYGEASQIVLTEDPTLAKRYHDHTHPEA